MTPEQREREQSKMGCEMPQTFANLSAENARLRAEVMEWKSLSIAADDVRRQAFCTAILMCSPDPPDEYSPEQRAAWFAACDEIEERITANRNKLRVVE